MKFSSRIKWALYCLGFLTAQSGFGPLYADDQNSEIPSQEQVIEEKQEETTVAQKQLQEDLLELHLRPTLELYKKLDFVLELLAQVINNNQVRGCKKTEALEHLKEIRGLVIQLQAGASQFNDPKTIQILNIIFEKVAKHIQSLVKNSFTEFKQLDLDAAITRAIGNQEISFDEIRAFTEKNEKLLKIVEAEATSVGLSKLNQVYRRAEKFVVDHRILPRAGLALLGSAFLWFLISSIRNEQPNPKFEQHIRSELQDLAKIKTALQQNAIPENVIADTLNQLAQAKPDIIEPVTIVKSDFIKLLQGYTGEFPRFDDKNHVVNFDKLKAPGTIALYLKEIGIANFILPAMLTWNMFSDVAKNQFNGIKNWTGKQWEILRSYLRGGPVIRKIETWNRDPRYRFSDVIGKGHIKQVLTRVVEYIRDHERFDRAGIVPAAGYLLAGPSRSGKTFMAEALAGEIKDALALKGITDKFNYLNFTAAEVLEIGISKVMAYAQFNAPCVLFIDEIDMLGAQRDRNAQLLSELLTAMSGAMMSNDNSRQVIVLAATNAPQNLDFALLQPGRFEKTLWFTHPTFEERALFLVKELDKRSIMTVDPEYIYKLAKETENISFEGLRSIIITALQYARAEGTTLNAAHLERAFDEEIRLILHEDPRLSPEEKKLIAVHQAGHALAASLLNSSLAVAKVTICPVNVKPKEEPVWMKYVDEKEKQESVEYGKMFTIRKERSGNFSSHEDLIAECTIDLAGYAAEKLLLGNTAYTYHRHDNQKALAMAKYITFKGMKEDQLPKEIRTQMHNEAYALVQKCEQEVTELLSQNIDKLKLIVAALEKYYILTGDELEYLLSGKKLESAADEAAEQSVPETADAVS